VKVPPTAHTYLCTHSKGKAATDSCHALKISIGAGGHLGPLVVGVPQDCAFVAHCMLNDNGLTAGATEQQQAAASQSVDVPATVAVHSSSGTGQNC
jgi:hypothetical protein